MTSAASSAGSRGWVRAAMNAEAIVMYGGIAAIAAMAFGGAFTHMHDWTMDALPKTPAVLAWGNAVISELMPTCSYLSARNRQRQGRKTTLPTMIFMISILLSYMANLFPVTQGIPGDDVFLATLPATALLVLSKMIFADVEYARKERERTAAEAERDAELKRAEAERAAELKAERDAELKRAEAELAAELARQEREHQAELAARAAQREADQAAELAKITAATEARRLELEAADRAAEREERMRIERRKADQEAAARAEAIRLEAEAKAEKERAEAALLAAQAEEKQQAAAALAGISRSDTGRGKHADDDDQTTTSRQRRPRQETQALVNAVLAGLPDGTTRDEAVAAVCVQVGMGARHARNFVPPGWVAGDLTNSEGLRLVS